MKTTPLDARPRRTPLALLALGVLIAAPTAALGQAPQATFRGAPGAGQSAGETMTQRPPRVETVDDAKTLLHYAVGVGVIALCVGVVVVPGRRDHDE